MRGARTCTPTHTIPAQIHGITDAAVKDAPTWTEVGPRLWGWLEERRVEQGAPRVTLVIHNANYDTRMIAAENARLAHRPAGPPGFSVVDTLQVCRDRLKLLKSHRQCVVYHHLFHEEAAAQHDALGDVRALVRICAHAVIARALADFVKPWVADGFQNKAPAPRAAVVPVVKQWFQNKSPPPRVAAAPAIHVDRRKGSRSVCGKCGATYSTHFTHTCGRLL